MAVTSTLATVKLIDQSDRNAIGDAVGFAPPRPSTETYATPLRPWIREISTSSSKEKGAGSSSVRLMGSYGPRQRQ
jgi:hypothetical protein